MSNRADSRGQCACGALAAGVASKTPSVGTVWKLSARGRDETIFTLEKSSSAGPAGGEVPGGEGRGDLTLFEPKSQSRVSFEISEMCDLLGKHCRRRLAGVASFLGALGLEIHTLSTCHPMTTTTCLCCRACLVNLV